MAEIGGEVYDFEEYVRIEARATKKEAILETRVQSICELLEDYGELPEHLISRLEEEQEVELLKSWLKLAAKVDSIEEFIEKM